MSIHHGGRGLAHISRMSTSAMSAIAEIYRTGSQGYWLDLQGTPGLYTDTGGTTAATWGDSVALALDHSRQMRFDARRNLLTYSEDFSATGWPTATNIVVADNDTTAPDGTSNADKLTDNTTAGVQHRLYRDYTFTSAAAHTFSVYAKRNNHQWFRLLFFDGTSTLYANFDLLNGVVGAKHASASSAISSVGNGWYRVSMSATVAAAAGNAQMVMLASDDPGAPSLYTGTGTSLWLFGAQLETGSTATAYQATTTLPTSWLGNHATQATGSKRPILGRHPRGGRRNLLTYSEDFSNAAWTNGGSSNATRTNGSITPTTSEGYAYHRNNNPLNSAVDHTISVTLTSDTTVNNVPIRATGTVNVTSLVNLVAGVPNRITITGFRPAPDHFQIGLDQRDAVVPGGANATGYAVTFNYVQLVVGSTATAYQKVVSTYDCTEAGVPDCRYLYAVTDDALATPAIDFTGTDKMTVFAGVRKLSDAAIGSLVELTASASANNGAFQIRAPTAISGNNYGMGSRGTSLGTGYAAASWPAPDSAVLTGLGEIATDTAIIRINGSQAAADTSDQGTGNYSNAVLYLFSRGGTSLPFNGFCYDLAVVGKLATSGEIAACEAQMNTAMGIY